MEKVRIRKIIEDIIFPAGRDSALLITIFLTWILDKI